MAWIAFNAAVGLLRFALGALVLGVGVIRGEWLALLGGWSECMVGGFSFWSSLQNKQMASGVGPLCCALCYLAGALVVPIGSAGAPWLVWVMVPAVVFKVFTAVLMQQNLSIGVPQFAYVCEWGPFRVIRHPGVLVAIVVKVAMAMAYPTAWNVFACQVAVGGALLSIIIEEQFLSGFESYRAYAERVRYRLIPGVV